MRRLVLAALAIGLGVVDNGAVADGSERMIRVEGKLAGARARFVVQRTIRLQAMAPGHQYPITIPVNSAAIGATVIDRGVRHPIPLVDAERARERFDAMMERDPGTRRGSVLLLEHGHHGDGLELYAAMPTNQTLTLELELDVPACFQGDLRHVLVPTEWKPVLSPALRPSPVAADVLASACSLDASDHVWLAFASPTPSQLFVHAGRLAANAQHFARVELDVASQLGSIPADLATAIVVDGSRSMTPAQLAAQRALVAAYLAAAPESRVQVIAFARRTRALLADWASARDTAKSIDATLRAIGPQNGSNIDAALDEAGRWLARTSGTRRILLIGDEHLAARFDAVNPAVLTRGLPAGTLIHVAAVTSYDDEPERADDAKLADLAASTGGMAITSGLPGTGIDATLLVRPIAIDNIEVTAPGWESFADCDGRWAEGSSCVWWAEGESLAGPVAVDGMIWGTRISRVVRPDPTLGTELARELVATELSRFTDDVRDDLEYAAHAVNGKWSLYAAWNGHGGYGDRGQNLTGGSFSSSSSVPHGIFGTGTRMPGIVPVVDLAPQLRAAVAACHANRPIAAQIETTLSEIVAVAVELGGAALEPTVRAKLTTCIEDAIWATAVVVPKGFPRGISTARFE